MYKKLLPKVFTMHYIYTMTYLPMPLLQATMIYAGFYTELLSCNPLNPIKLTMVRLDTVDCRYYYVPRHVRHV